MKKTTLTIIAFITVIFSSFAQNVNIPDANFKKYLIGRTDSINTDANKLEISVAEAKAFNGRIFVPISSITSLVGIEAFTNLTRLICHYNQLTSIDVSKNTALTEFVCANNQLKSLDVSKNMALTVLNFQSNQLKNLDITNNTALTELFFDNNNLTTLDVSKCPALTVLWCQYNQLTILDVTKNTALIKLYFDNNKIASLDVTKNTAIKTLNCQNNQLSSLDVSKCPALTELFCVGNPNLKCIQALNSQVRTNWEKDFNAQYNENCNYVTSINEEILTQPKTILATYNLQGQPVNNSYQGLVIIRYSDGTSEKVIQ